MELESFLRKLKRKVSIYPWVFFDRRIYEESAMALMENRQFFYAEINFKLLEEQIANNVLLSEFFKALLTWLSTKKRVSDVCGLLKEEIGIGLIFMNESENGVGYGSWNRLCDEICSKCSVDLRNLDKVVYSVAYPPKEFLKQN